MRKSVTQDQVNSYRDQVRAKFAGRPFQIDSNGYGIRVECKLCHDSVTDFPEIFLNEHRHGEVTGGADFSTETRNPDGTVTRILYFV